MTTTLSCPEGVEVKGRVTPEVAEILTPEALDFVARLERKFGERRKELLARRAQRQERFDAGELPDFLPETRSIREAILDDRSLAGGSAGPTGGDHRSGGRPENGDQRPQFGSQMLYGRL